MRDRHVLWDGTEPIGCLGPHTATDWELGIGWGAGGTVEHGVPPVSGLGVGRSSTYRDTTIEHEQDWEEQEDELDDTLQAGVDAYIDNFEFSDCVEWPSESDWPYWMTCPEKFLGKYSCCLDPSSMTQSKGWVDILGDLAAYEAFVDLDLDFDVYQHDLLLAAWGLLVENPLLTDWAACFVLGADRIAKRSCIQQTILGQAGTGAILTGVIVSSLLDPALGGAAALAEALAEGDSRIKIRIDSLLCTDDQGMRGWPFNEIQVCPGNYVLTELSSLLVLLEGRR